MTLTTVRLTSVNGEHDRSQSNGDQPAIVDPVRAETHEEPLTALPQPDRPAIAVLAFINMRGDPEGKLF
jgi:hypothetical protein